MTELQNILVPKENVNDEYIIINQLYFKNGDKVIKGDIVADIETSKTNFSIEAEQDGFIIFFCKETEELSIGKSIAKIFDSYDEKMVPQLFAVNNISLPERSHSISAPEFSNAAAILVKQYNLSEHQFSEKDFVTSNEILNILNPNKRQKRNQSLDPELNFQLYKDNVTIEELNSAKKREIRYLTSVQEAGLTCTFSINVNHEGILKYTRKNHKIFKLTIIPTLILEVAKLLKEFSILNAFFYENKIVKFNKINIGYALDIDQGLKVITIYDADKLSLEEVEIELQTKIDKYSNGMLEVNDLSNSTFTITDLSNSGIHYFRPLVNKNQAAILGISSVDLNINSFNISLTFDHRVTEGKVVSTFLNKLKRQMEVYSVKSDSQQKKREIKKLSDKLSEKLKNGDINNYDQIQILNELLALLS